MHYYLIYDGDCNLCVTFARLLRQFEGGELFEYVPMQDEQRLQQWGITAQDCEGGMILLEAPDPHRPPDRRWQGSEAAEEIIRLLPGGAGFVAAYRIMPGAKWLGDRTYEQIRDRRYQWFGAREQTHWIACGSPGDRRSNPPQENTP
jgi:predicted DCC family thiol-disulfide oxidoreductase YuxK